MTSRAISCVLVIALSAGPSGQTDHRGRTEDEALRVTDRIRSLQSEADRLAGQARTLIGDLRTLEIDRELQVERVRQAQAAIAEGQAALDDTARRLASLEEQRTAQLPDLQAQLVDIYKRGRAGYATLLFGSTGVREFGRATRAIGALLKINQERVAEHRRTLATVQQERTRLEGELDALQARVAEAQQGQAAADRALQARTALIAQIDTRRDLNAQLAGELRLAHERLQQQVATLGPGRPADPAGIPMAPFRGALGWPVPGRLTGQFGQRVGRPGDTAVRNGVEIAAAEGTPVHAIHQGTISFADLFTGFGNLVIVDHGAGAYSLYGYLGAISVAPGDTIDSGTELGRVGSAPAGPAALYLEIRIDGRSVDPVQWLKPR